MRPTPKSFFSSYPFPTNRLGRVLRKLLGKPLGFNKLEREYAKLPPAASTQDFLTQALDQLHIDVAIADGHLDHIPKIGPLIVVANHPFGAMDGLVLAHTLLKARDDVRIYGRPHFGLVREGRDLLLAIEPFGGRRKLSKRIVALRQAVRWVKQGGVLLVFPAGHAARLQLHDGHITDPKWQHTIARIVNRTQAAVLPIHIHGKHHTLYKLLSLIHRRIRPFLLAKELLNQAHNQVQLRIGRPIAPKKLAKLKGRSQRQALTDYLRLSTFALFEDISAPKVEQNPRPKPNTFSPLAEPMSK